MGGLVVGIFYKLLMPGHRPLGIPEVVEAAAFKGGRMPVGPGFMAVVGSALSLGAGASVGREGPAVTLGAVISAWLAERLQFDRRSRACCLDAARRQPSQPASTRRLPACCLPMR